MGKHFRYINTPENCINTDVFFKDVEEAKEFCVCGSGYWPGQWQHNSNIFTDEFRNWLDSFNCKILKAEAFRVFPKTSLAWHNDTNDNPNDDDLDPNMTTKINFMWGDLTKCFMEYGNVSDQSGVKIVKNRRGRRAYVYNDQKMLIEERFSLEHTILINRGPAHRVTNESDSDWICISCIIANKEDVPLLFDDARVLFNSVCMS